MTERPPFVMHRAESSDAMQLDVKQLLVMARRQLWLVVLGVAAGLVLAIAYIVTTPPTYVAYASVLVEDRASELVEEVSPAPANQRNDATVLSEIEILRSQRMAQIVARDLDLANDAEFMQPPTSLLSEAIGAAIGPVRQLIGRAVDALQSEAPAPATNDARPALTPEQIQRAGTLARSQLTPFDIAVLRLRGGLRVSRAGRSYVISIGFTSHSPRIAQAVTNAYARAYVADGLETSFDKTRQAAEWMQDRLGELEVDTRRAALEAEEFRAENGLTSTRGLLVTEQQVSDLNAQLALARGDAARATARLEQAEALLSGEIEPAIAGAAFVEDGQPVNPTLAALRESYLELIARERDIIERYGPDHPQVEAIQRGKAQQEARIIDELQSTIQSFRNLAQSASAREAALQESVSQATGQNVEASQAQVRLRELEQRATTLGQLYQTFLGRFEELSQQGSFPIARVRTLSEADLPRNKSAPSTTRTALALMMLGGMAGGGIGALRELRERFLRTEADVTRALQVPFLGYVPEINLKKVKERRARRRKRGEPDEEPPEPKLEDGAESPEAARMLASLSSPSSMLAETLRNVRVAADVTAQRSDGLVLGVVSVLPGEGKSTLAANLAAQLAASGSATLLIDADLRKPTISRALFPSSQSSLIDGVLQQRSWRELAQRVGGTELLVVPNAMTGRLAHTSELLSSERMRAFLDEARADFRYIVLDLPPMAPVADAKAASPLVDGMVLVSHWGKTPRAMVRKQIDSVPEIRRKLLGAVLNRVDLKRLPRYEDDSGQGHFLDQYSDYYTEPSVGLVKSGRAKR